MGASAYEVMRQLLLWPSISLLTPILDRLPLRAGITEFTTDYLTSIAKHHFDEKELQSMVLMWDEINIQELLEIQGLNGDLIGNEDWGTERSNKLANHVLVFALRSLTSGKKVPLSFYFSHGPTKSDRLQVLIKENIKTASETGYKVIGKVVI